MRPFALLTLYLVAAYVGRALLEYPVFRLANVFTEVPFEAVSDRTFLLVAALLLGLPFFLRALGINDKVALGYGLARPQFIRITAMGVVAGMLIMLPLVVCLFVFDVRVFSTHNQPTWQALSVIALDALFSGLLIGIIEETFFRGAVFSALHRGSGLAAALGLSSLLYAILHFDDSSLRISPQDVHWLSGIMVLRHSFSDLLQPTQIIDSLLALFSVGVFLALVRAKMGHIALCIGLHAGWVVTIKLVKAGSELNPNASLAFLVGGYDGIIGYLSLIWMGTLSLVYYYFQLHKKTPR